jgi:hypothetical protein
LLRFPSFLFLPSRFSPHVLSFTFLRIPSFLSSRSFFPSFAFCF